MFRLMHKTKIALRSLVVNQNILLDDYVIPTDVIFFNNSILAHAHVLHVTGFVRELAGSLIFLYRRNGLV
jgi:hypothetical protein